MWPLLRLLGRLNRRFYIAIGVLLLLESWHHINGLRVSRPEYPLDLPFDADLVLDAAANTTTENAAIMMLARNSEVEQAVETLRSLEQQFNQRYHYPVVFLNNKPWSDEFIDAVSKVVSGKAIFDTIGEDMWGYPDWIDEAAAEASIAEQGAAHIVHAGDVNYHHMCRFYSMKFYDHPAMKPFKWYWRIEPGIEYTCPIPFDPFQHMSHQRKRYGYAIALQEVGSTTPTLFSTTSSYKSQNNIGTSDIWRAMVKASWAPFPLRWLMRFLPYRDASGDEWNLCHFWNNFEIADMDFFREPEYRKFVQHLDDTGGFYFERWGDAPVRSLGAALYLQPEQIHYFGDEVCYCHDKFCSDGVDLLATDTGLPLDKPAREKRRGTWDGQCVDQFKKMVMPS